MPIETERRFLVKDLDDYALHDNIAGSPAYIHQGYLSLGKNIVRVRTTQWKYGSPLCWLCVKGPKVNGSGPEFEYEIPEAHAKELMLMCGAYVVSKTRYQIVPNEFGQIYEVDVFDGLNGGLVIAEVELPTINTPIKLPKFVGKEITNDFRYSNVELARNPFLTWTINERSL